MPHKNKILIPNRALVAVTGADGLNLLQRLVTADLEPLAEADGAFYTLLLTPQGKYRFDFFVVKQEGELFLDAPAGQAAALIEALEKYRLRADVQFRIMPEATVLSGPHHENGLFSFKDPRHDGLGWRSWQGEGAQVEPEGTAFDYDIMRVRLGVVEPADDLPEDNAMPLEYGLDKLNAISFTKGCYLGQELTARMHNRNLAKYEVIVTRDIDDLTGTVLAQASGMSLVQVRREGTR